jgi:hypothetical protein
MPIERFRSHEEARLAQWMAPDDPRLLERIRRWWRTAARLSPVTPPRGVQRFRNMEEANAARDAWPRTVWPVVEDRERDRP